MDLTKLEQRAELVLAVLGGNTKTVLSTWLTRRRIPKNRIPVDVAA
jgi:hypothetical protein